MKFLASVVLLSQLLIADINSCITVTYKNANLKLSEKKVCCTIMQTKEIDLETRSRNGWYRYTVRNNWSVVEREEFMKCIDSYFNASRETRIGGTL